MPLQIVRAQVADAAARLAASNAPDEALAEWQPEPRILRFIKLPAKFVPLRRAWRLGVFLIDREGTLWAAGSATRAVRPGRANYQSVSGEQRRAYREAASRGPFVEGETVNFGARMIDLTSEASAAASGPLLFVDGRALVRWNPTADAATARDFGDYLRERVELLLEPPAGA